MDKDLKDAVLAAFDGEAEDETLTPDPATDGAADGAATVVPKPGSAQKKTDPALAGTARRVPTPGAPAAATGRQHAVPTPTVARGPAPARGAASRMLSLLLTVVLVVLVVILLVQTLSLKAAVSRQAAVLKDLKNLARITVSVYQEPGKRAQQVIAGYDVDENGTVKIERMIIRPLPDE